MTITLAALGMLALGAEPPVVEVRPHNGAPTLFVNGAPHPGTSYMTYRPEGRNFKAFGEANVHLYSFSATPTDSTYNLAPPCWTAPDTFDYSGLDDRVHLLLENDPQAYFFPRVYLGAPPWWADQYPDDLVRYDPGDGNPVPFVLRGKRVASWASSKWREDTAAAMRRLIQHVEQSDYADRVIGYHIASGTTEEWMQWGSNEDQWTDYSPVNVERFRAWLRDRYGNDAALEAAWRDPSVTLDTAAVPPRSQREAGERGWLRDPEQARPCIDYVLYTSWLVADTIRFFAQSTKDAVDHQRLVGVFYGYVLQLAGAQREQNSGHLALRDVFACPDVDFITSPCSYASRELGTGYPHAMSLADSIAHHGKLWFDENDFRTWLAQNVPDGFPGHTKTYEDTLLSQQREFAWTFTNRHGMWWFDMGGGWYDDPRILADVRHMNAIAWDNLDADASPIAEIAFVVDATSAAYLQPSNPFTWHALVKQMPLLARIGAPFATVDLADLESLPAYKLYIFPNCFAPGESERECIAHLVERGASIFWMGPAGLYRDGVMAPENMAQLTGLPLQLIDTGAPWRVVPTDAAAAWGWTAPQPYGPGQPGQLLAVPQDGTGVVLGRIDGTEYPALVARERNGATTIFSSIPLLPPGLLRAVARKAGVHLYTDTNDIVWARSDLLAVSVHEGGTRTIRLPRPRRAVDLWTDRTIAEDADSFETTIPTNGAALFRLF